MGSHHLRLEDIGTAVEVWGFEDDCGSRFRPGVDSVGGSAGRAELVLHRLTLKKSTDDQEAARKAADAGR